MGLLDLLPSRARRPAGIAAGGGYLLEAANRTGRRVFVTGIDGGHRQGSLLEPGGTAVILDSSSLGPHRPTWRIAVVPEYDREDGPPVYRHLFGIGADLQVERPDRPTIQRILLVLTQARPLVHGPALQVPPSN